MFTPDPKLSNNSFHLIDWPLCQVRLQNNSGFPWLMLIPRTTELVREMHELNSDQQQQMMHEMMFASRLVQEHFDAEKINIGALGNIVPQLHIHVVARFKNDAMWPHSLWQESLPQTAYSAEEAELLCEELKAKLK